MEVEENLPDFMPSRLFIYFNERKIEGTVDEDSGAMIRDGIKSIHKLGGSAEDVWPYDIARFTDPPSSEAYTERRATRRWLYRRVLQVLHEMQGCLASGVPFVFGFSVYESFEASRSR